MRSRSETLQVRFDRNVQRTETCWLWTAGKDRDGYGMMKWQGKCIRAFRVSLILAGTPAPTAVPVDHICRVRACVNPAHLRVASWRENALENSVSPSAVNAQKLQCPKGHSYTHMRAGGRRCTVCAQSNARQYQARYHEGVRLPNPTKEELAVLLDTESWAAIGRRYGVSDNAVRKWAQKFGLR